MVYSRGGRKDRIRIRRVVFWGASYGRREGAGRRSKGWQVIGYWGGIGKSKTWEGSRRMGLEFWQNHLTTRITAPVPILGSGSPHRDREV